MQSAALDGLVDRLDELAVLDVGLRTVTRRDRRLETAEEGLDLRRVAAVFETLALGAQNPLLL